MAPIRNGRHLFNEVPTGYPVPGKTTIYDSSQTIDPETVPLNGGFLIKTLVLSIDPYLRGLMLGPSAKTYAPMFVVGEPLSGGGVGVVLRSENPGVKVGDHVYGILNFEEYFVMNDSTGLRIIKNEENLPWSVYVGAAGMPGKTAYMAWKEYAHPNKGDVVFVTTGAGPVGSLVIQLAKLDGLKVIASAGSEEKVKFLKEIGTDVAFNYKTTDTREVLAKEGPINIYWDNVGGEILDAALDAAARHATFIECGMISSYNSGYNRPVRNLFNVVVKSIAMHGFNVFQLSEKYEDEFYETVPARIAKGELKFREDVTVGLEKVGEAILAVQTGKNNGKSVIQVADA